MSATISPNPQFVRAGTYEEADKMQRLLATAFPWLEKALSVALHSRARFPHLFSHTHTHPPLHPPPSLASPGHIFLVIRHSPPKIPMHITASLPFLRSTFALRRTFLKRHPRFPVLFDMKVSSRITRQRSKRARPF